MSEKTEREPGCECETTYESDTCPYAEEIHGDSETQCTCCAQCRHNCAMSI